MKNADKIRESLTNEKLAHMLNCLEESNFDIYNEFGFPTKLCDSCEHDIDEGNGCKNDCDCTEAILNWLNQDALDK